MPTWVYELAIIEQSFSAYLSLQNYQSDTKAVVRELNSKGTMALV